MAILVGSVEVDVVPNTESFIPVLKRELTPNARALGRTLGEQVGDGINERIRERLGDPFDNLPTRGPRESGRRTGEAFGGAYNDAVQSKVRAALRNLPTPQIGVATTEADQQLRDLRTQLETLSNQTIGVDIDSTAALAEVRRIQAELTRLGRDSADVQVRVDTAAASAKLAALEIELSRLDGSDIDISANVQTNSNDLNTFVGRLAALALAGAAIGPAVVPAVAAVVAGIGALGPVTLAAASGVGALALAFTGVTDAVTATQEATDSAAKDAEAAAAAQTQAANAVASAQAAASSATAAYANTVASADAAAIRSSRAVAGARAAVATTVSRAASANAAASAAYVVAERAVQRAVRDSTEAQLDLVAARKSAQQQLEDLASAVKNGALDERAGVLAVTDAQNALNLARIDPQATQTSIAAAQLAYEQAVQNLEDQRTRNKRLADEKADADRKGVEGSDLVLDAQQRLKDAVTAEADARKAAAAAQAKIRQTQIDGAAAVKKAEQGVTIALTAQADQARTAAYSISQAQEAIAGSQRGLAAANDALTKSQEAQSSAAEKAADALAKLSPAGVGFVGFVNDELRPAFKQLREAAQEGILPGVQSGLKSLLPAVEPVRRFLVGLSNLIGDLFARAGEALTAPFWRTFFTDLANIAGPALLGLIKSIGNLITGFAGLIQAFIPVSSAFGLGLVDMTKSFAEFGKTLKDNPAFQEFIEYAAANAPRVIELISELVKVIVHIGVAAAPIGVVVVEVLTLIAKAINAIPTPVLTVLLGLLATFAVTIGTINAASKIYTGTLAFQARALQLYEAICRRVNTVNLAAARAWLQLQLAAARARLATIAASIAAGASAIAAGIAAAATAAWAAATTALAAAVAFLLSPIGLIILAIAALVVVAILVWKNFDKIKAAAIRTWEWIKENWPKLKAILLFPFKLFSEFAPKAFDIGKRKAAEFANFGIRKMTEFGDFLSGLPARLKAKLSELWNGFKQEALKATIYGRDKFNAFVSFLGDLPGKLKDKLLNFFSPLAEGFKNTINDIIRGYNNLSFTFGGGSIGGVSIPSVTIDTPDLPLLAAGGVVTGPTIAMIGEAGPEAVVPLKDSALLASLLGKASASASPSSSVGDRNVTINQTIVNPIPERASVSGPAALRRAALALGS